MKILKRAICAVIITFSIFLLSSCKHFNFLSANVFVKYNLDGGVFLEDELNNKIKNGIYSIKIDKKDNKIILPGEDTSFKKEFEPYKIVDGQKHYLEYYYEKEDEKKRAYFFTAQHYNDEGEKVKLTKSIELVAKYAPKPGLLSLDSILRRYRMSEAVFPSQDVNILVLPICFLDTTDKVKFKDDLNNVFNKDIKENGFYGVSQYFKEVSKNKLNLNFHIITPQKSSMTVEEIEKAKEKEVALPEQQIISDIFRDELGKENSEIKELFKNYNFDANGDGNIDGVYAVYDREYSFDYKNIKKINDEIVWFTYSARMLVSRRFDINDKEYTFIDYSWSSYSFLFEELFAKTKIGEQVFPLPNSALKYNSIYYIHEVCKLLGLVDLFSLNLMKPTASSNTPRGGLGQTDIMDLTFKLKEVLINPGIDAIPHFDIIQHFLPPEVHNLINHPNPHAPRIPVPIKPVVGFSLGFNPYNKILLDWASYELFNKDVLEYTITKKDLSEKDHFLVIPKNPSTNSLFSEFIVLDFYKPVGIDEIGKNYEVSFKNDCVRIYHVDATIKKDGYSRDLINLIPFLYEKNNISGSKKYIRLVEKTKNIENFPFKYSDTESVWYQDDVLENFKWNDGSQFEYKIKIESLNLDNAKIKLYK